MPAYIHADIEVLDPTLYEEYRRQVKPIVDRHSGRFLVRGGAVELLEGERAIRRQVLIEFPSMQALRAFYGDPAYVPLIALRQRASRGSLVAIEGVPPAA